MMHPTFPEPNYRSVLSEQDIWTRGNGKEREEEEMGEERGLFMSEQLQLFFFLNDVS